MAFRFYLRSYVDDFTYYNQSFDGRDQTEIRKLMREHFKQWGWKVTFSGSDRVYLTKGKERRHFFIWKESLTCGTN